MAVVSYLRRLKVPIPQEIRDHFKENDFLRFGIIYEGNGNGNYSGKISIHLVPRKGGTFNDYFPKVVEIKLETKNSADYATEARKMAGDESNLTRLLVDRKFS